MDAKPTEMGIFHIFKSDQMCKFFNIIYDINFDQVSSLCKIKL